MGCDEFQVKAAWVFIDLEAIACGGSFILIACTLAVVVIRKETKWRLLKATVLMELLDLTINHMLVAKWQLVFVLVVLALSSLDALLSLSFLIKFISIDYHWRKVLAFGYYRLCLEGPLKLNLTVCSVLSR